MKRKISKSQLYEQIMKVVSKELNKALNEDFTRSSASSAMRRTREAIEKERAEREKEYEEERLEREKERLEREKEYEKERLEREKEYEEERLEREKERQANLEKQRQELEEQDDEDDDELVYFGWLGRGGLRSIGDLNESLRNWNWDDIKDMLNEFIDQYSDEIDFEDANNNDIDDLMVSLKDWAMNVYFDDSEYQLKRLFNIYEDDIRQWFWDECIVNEI